MESVRGFVTIGYTRSEVWVMGRPEQNFGRPYQSFETNGLKPFGLRGEAVSVAKEMVKCDSRLFIRRVEVAEIRMEIAETEEEVERLPEIGSFVAIARYEFSTVLYGVSNDRHQTYIGGHLLLNGLRPFRRRDHAVHCGREINRQGQGGAKVATFRLRKVSMRMPRKSRVKRKQGLPR